jgi:hypothetical protein
LAELVNKRFKNFISPASKHLKIFENLNMSNPERNNSSDPEYQGRKREVRDNSCRPFVQIDIELIKLLNNSEFKLYAQIKKRAGSVDGKCWESIEHMAIETNMSVATIKRASRSLLSKNLIKKIKRPGMTALYELTPPSEWNFDSDWSGTAELISIDKGSVGQNDLGQNDLGQNDLGQNDLGVAQNDLGVAQNDLCSVAQNDPCSVAQNDLLIRSNLLIRSSSELNKKELDPTPRNPEAHMRGGVGAYLCDSKSKENPETAADRGQDSGIEPLRKATIEQNPEPETAFKDCPEPDIDQDAAIFRNSETSPSYRATTNNQPSSRNPDIEKTNIPPAAAKISGVEAASPPSQVVEAINPNSSGLTARFSQEEQESLINQAIATYNQHRGRWGYCPFLSNTGRSQLLKLLFQLPGDRVSKSFEFISLVRDATFWCIKSDWLNRPEFENKHFSYLIGRNGEGDRILDYASKWRSLPEEAMVGAALKITQSAGEKTYCHPDGTPTELAWARLDWKDISKRAKAGEPVSQAEKDWANYYFPQFDIYLEHEEI